MVLITLFTSAQVSFAQMACYDLFIKKEHIFVSQKNDYYCGPAVLQSTLNASGIKVSQTELARIAKTTSKLGTSPQNMARVIAEFGLRADILKVTSLTELRELLKDSETVIALITSEGEAHWVIIDSTLPGGGFRLMDPWTAFKGLRNISGDELLASWQTQFDKTPLQNLAIVVSRETK